MLLKNVKSYKKGGIKIYGAYCISCSLALDYAEIGHLYDQDQFMLNQTCFMEQIL